MAVTARFIADFASFSAAVQKAEVELRSFEQGAAKVGTALNRMTDSFSGRKVIQEATLMAEVFKRAGGAASFTTAELARMGTVGAEAMEKITRTGAPIPPQLKAMADATKGVGQQTSLLTTGIVALAGAFTLAKVVGFASNLVNAAGALQDFHERTDISIAGLQRFKIIAEQSGSSLDAVATAVFQMGRRFAGDDKSAAKAVAELGLSFAHLRAMRPEDAFNAVGKALGALDDPMKRSQLGVAIFGRSVDELVPTLKHLNDEMGSVVTLSAAQVGAIDALGDAYVRAKASLVPLTVAFVDNTFQLSRSYAFWSALLGKIDEAPKVIGSAQAALEAMNAGVGGRALQPVGGEDLDRIQKQAVEELNAALADKTKRLADAKTAAEKLAKANVEAAKALRDFHNEIGVRFIADVEAANKATADAAASLRKFHNEIGAQEISDIEQMNKATAETAAAMRDLNNALGVLDMEARAHEFAFVGPIQDGLIKQTQTWGQSLNGLADTMVQFAQVSGDSFGGLLKVMAQVIVAFDGLATATKAASAASTASTAATASLALSYVGIALAVWQYGASLMGLSAEEKQAAARLWELEKQLMATATAAEIAAAGTRHMFGFGEHLDRTALGLQQLTELYGLLGLSAQQAAADWAKAASGAQSGVDAVQGALDTQRAILEAIHAMGSFTQEELQAVADKSKEVFDFMMRAGTYSAEQLAKAWQQFERDQAIAMGEISADAAVDAFGEAADAVDALSERYKTLSDSVAKEAPEKIMGSIERAARAEMATLEKQMDAQAKQMEADAKAAAAALEKALAAIDPNPVHVQVIWDIPDLPGSRVEMPETNPGHSGGSATGGGGTAIINLDSREVARVVVPHIPGVVQEYGIG